MSKDCPLIFFKIQMRKWHASIWVEKVIGRDPKLVFQNSALMRKAAFPLLTLYKKPSLLLPPPTLNPFSVGTTGGSITSLYKFADYFIRLNNSRILLQNWNLLRCFSCSRVFPLELLAHPDSHSFRHIGIYTENKLRRKQSIYTVLVGPLPKHIWSRETTRNLESEAMENRIDAINDVIVEITSPLKSVCFPSVKGECWTWFSISDILWFNEHLVLLNPFCYDSN